MDNTKLSIIISHPYLFIIKNLPFLQNETSDNISQNKINAHCGK